MLDTSLLNAHTYIIDVISIAQIIIWQQLELYVSPATSNANLLESTKSSKSSNFDFIM